MSENELQPGQRVGGRYIVRRMMGKGGMGAVYEAEHEELGRTVALKVLLAEHSANQGATQRFLREARAAASIGHRGIVQVFDLGVDASGLVFLAMEKLEGEELTERVRRAHPVSWRFAAQVGLEVADAIGAAHARGIVHRDVKPQNVFVVSDGRAESFKVLDFGVAKLLSPDGEGISLTETGQVVGTPLYMAPEQLQGVKDVDARADVYAIGALLYETLAGRPPLVADSYQELVYKMVTVTPPSLTAFRPDLPPVFVAVITRALSRDRAARYADGRAFADALQAVLSDPESDTHLPATPALVGLAETQQAPSGDQLMQTTPLVSESMWNRRGSQQRSRQWQIAGAVVLIGVALGAWMLRQAPAPALDTPRGSTVVTAAPKPVPLPPRENTALPPALDPPSATQPLPPHRLAITTVPASAAIEINGAPACEATPCEVTLTGDTVRLRATRRGYLPVERQLTRPFEDALRLPLTRLTPTRADGNPPPLKHR